MTPWAEQIQVLREVIRIFEEHAVAYAVGGSIASSMFGIPRFTRDADVSIAPFSGKEQSIVDSLGSEYYASAAAMRTANLRRGSFNIIHPRFGFKVDCFVLGDRPLDKNLLRRAIRVSFEDVPSEPLSLVSPEDVLLLKLDWYRRGGEVSSQQWSDVLAVLRTRSGSLDESYLNELAGPLNVTDLLKRAKQEAAG